MSVRVAARIPDGLHARIVARAEAETRSLSNMLERLLELGLGVVDESSRVVVARPVVPEYREPEPVRGGETTLAPPFKGPDWRVK